MTRHTGSTLVDVRTLSAAPVIRVRGGANLSRRCSATAVRRRQIHPEVWKLYRRTEGISTDHEAIRPDECMLIHQGAAVMSVVVNGE
jgi:hypothetical protein